MKHVIAAVVLVAIGLLFFWALQAHSACLTREISMFDTREFWEIGTILFGCIGIGATAVYILRKD